MQEALIQQKPLVQNLNLSVEKSRKLAFQLLEIDSIIRFHTSNYFGKSRKLNKNLKQVSFEFNQLEAISLTFPTLMQLLDNFVGQIGNQKNKALATSSTISIYGIINICKMIAKSLNDSESESENSANGIPTFETEIAKAEFIGGLFEKLTLIFSNCFDYEHSNLVFESNITKEYLRESHLKMPKVLILIQSLKKEIVTLYSRCISLFSISNVTQILSNSFKNIINVQNTCSTEDLPIYFAQELRKDIEGGCMVGLVGAYLEIIEKLVSFSTTNLDFSKISNEFELILQISDITDHKLLQTLIMFIFSKSKPIPSMESCKRCLRSILKANQKLQIETSTSRFQRREIEKPNEDNQFQFWRIVEKAISPTLMTLITYLDATLGLISGMEALGELFATLK